MDSQASAGPYTGMGEHSANLMKNIQRQKQAQTPVAGTRRQMSSSSNLTKNPSTAKL